MSFKKGQSGNPNGRPAGFKMTEEHKRKVSAAKQDHGLYALIRGMKAGRNVIDGRTQGGKAINAAYQAILEECGPQPTQKQVTVCDMARTKLAVLHLVGKAVLGTEPNQLSDKKELLHVWLRYSESLGRDFTLLDKLGEKRQGPMEYHEYVKQLVFRH